MGLTKVGFMTLDEDEHDNATMYVAITERQSDSEAYLRHGRTPRRSL